MSDQNNKWNKWKLAILAFIAGRRLQLLAIHLLLIGTLVSFNNCGGSFNASSMSDGGGLLDISTTKLRRNDTVPPVISVSSTPASSTTSTSASFVFAVTDNSSGVASVKCSLDNVAFSSCVSPVNLSNLVVGNHNFRIQATDVAGNVSPIYSYSWNITFTTSPASLPKVSLTVAGAPNLPFNGTTTLVTVGFISGIPVQVQLSRDGNPGFVSWPSGTFFTLAADGKSLTGNWCISSSCWGGVTGTHVLNVLATYSDGSTATASVTLNVADVTTIALPSPQSPTGPTYYLSPNGNDANTGSASAPWKTIQKAANTLVAGDTVILMDGNYEEPQVNFSHSGTASAPITFQAQNKWMAVLYSTSGCNPGFSISASYITVRGLRFSVSPNNPTCTTYTSANVAIRAWESMEPTPSNPSTGTAGFHADGIKIDAGRAEGLKSNQDNTIIENSESANSLEIFDSFNSIVRNNIVTGQDQDGVSIFAKGGIRNAQIYGNIIHNTAASGNGIILGGYSCDTCHFDTSTNIEAYNSVAYNNVVINEGTGVMAGLMFQGAKDSAFFNNVVINGQLAMTIGGHNTGPQAPTSNPKFMNNIVLCNGGVLNSGWFGWAYSGTAAIDYNNFYNCSGAASQSHAITGNPLFVNSASDWHLQSGSSAINSGTPITMPGYNGTIIDVSRDKDGVVRSSPWDLGIYNVTP
jgi:hypothetical protein